MSPHSHSSAGSKFPWSGFHPARISGFTLLELLVVIAIIAMLAILLTPFFGTVLERSRAARCASNLRQLYLVAQAFSNDHNGRIVRGYGGGDDPGGDGYWIWSDALTPYVGTDPGGSRPFGIFACPSSKALRSGGARSDYASNSFVNGALNTDGSDGNLRLISLNRPSKIIFLIDSVSNDGSCNRSVSPWSNPPNWGVAFRHGGSDPEKGFANTLYFDGHVQALKKAAIPLAIDSYLKLPWNPLATE